MELIVRKDVPEQLLPGRFMQKIVGKTEDGYLSDSRILNIGYCRYCAEAVPHGAPHARRGDGADPLLRQSLGALRAQQGRPAQQDPVGKGHDAPYPPREWHVFEYEEGGSLEILFIYGSQVAL